MLSLGCGSEHFYYHPHTPDDLDLRAAIDEVALDYPRYGYRRVHAELVRRGWQINHKRVQRLMQEANLIVEVRHYCQTTNSRHSYGRYPNLVKYLEIVRPHQVWAADLTYILRLERQFVAPLSLARAVYSIHTWLGVGRTHERRLT